MDKQLIELLERWVSAYQGYALTAVHMSERSSYVEEHSTENIGRLLRETFETMSKVKHDEDVDQGRVDIDLGDLGILRDFHSSIARYMSDVDDILSDLEEQDTKNRQ